MRLIQLFITMLCGLHCATTTFAASGAAGYADETSRILAALKKALPHITLTAERAALRYVHGDEVGEYGIGADGDPIFIWEATSRAGGIAGMSKWNINPKQGPFKRGIILFCLQEGDLVAQEKRIRDWTESGSTVILFGRADLLQAMNEAKVEVEDQVVIPAAEHGGLVPGPNDNWLLPTDPVAVMSTLWVWTAEFVSACSRQGKMPTMLLSIMVPGGKERLEQLTKVKFHEETPRAVKAGSLGRAWLRTARKQMATVRRRDMRTIRTVAQSALAAKMSGHTLWIVAEGHGAGQVPGLPQDAGFFTVGKSPIPFQEGDYLLVMGYKDISPELAAQARAANVRIAWSCADFLPETRAAVLTNELFIDQPWSFGDAEVTMPGYDIKLFPTSGIINTTIYQMINGEMLALQKKAMQKR